MSNALMEKEGIGIQNIHIRFISNTSPDTMTTLTRNMFYLPGDKKEQDDKIAPDEKVMQGGEQIQNTNNTSDGKPKTTSDSEYPYFTDTSRLNVDKLNKLSRTDLIDAFFNIKNFKKHITLTTSTHKDVRSENAEYNFNAMMKFLLCTTFPIKHNIKNTFSENITQISSESQADATSVLDMVKKVFTSSSDKFCYFMINGTKSTLLSVTHINDLINDKSFNTTLKTIYAFKEWRADKIQKLEKYQEELSKKFDTIFKDKFGNIQNTLKNDESTKIQIKKLSSAQQLSLPRSLLQPYLEELQNKTDKQDIEKAFLKIANLNYTGSKETTASFWIPPAFTTINGFSEMMNTVFKLSITTKQLQYLKDELTKIKDVMKKVKQKEKKSQIGDADEEVALEYIQKKIELKEFFEKIKKLIPPKRMYSNSKLETALQNYNNVEFFKFIQFIHDMKKEDDFDKSLLNNKPFIDQLRTGIMSVIESDESSDKEKKDVFSLSAKKYYDTFISLELIKGELNKDNVDIIKCPYKNTMLSNEYIKLQNISDDKNPALLYIPTVILDIDMLKKNSKSNKKQTTQRKKQLGGWQPHQNKKATRKKRKVTKKEKENKRKKDSSVNKSPSPNRSLNQETPKEDN